MHRVPRHLWIVLIAALLVTRVAILEHELDFAAHAAGESCELCLHAAPLDHGVSAYSTVYLPLESGSLRFKLYAPAVAGAPVYRPRARDPPVVSSIV